MNKKSKNRKNNILFLSVLMVSLSFSFLLFKNSVLADDSDTEKSIKNLEKQLNSEQKEKSKLEQELANIQQNVNASQRDIIKTELLIKQAEENITKKEAEIKNINSKVELQKEGLRSLLREVYYAKQEPLAAVVLKEEDFIKAWGNIDNILTLDQKIVDLINDIKESKVAIESDKKEVLETKEDHEKLLDLKENQQKALLTDKKETQTDIAQKEATIGELQGKLSQLKSNLSGFLGKAYDAKDVEDAASFASKATGVRKDFIMGMLTVESDLGRFTGGCYAKDSRMSGSRLTLFKKICSELDYKWEKRKVSCPPKSYKGTGGAMGVAQFMSDTWTGYKSSIASKTGHNPPDPWNLTDGVMAMGLKLARGGATSKSGECNAAKLYLSGTTSSKYNWYCEKVLYWAKNYEDKL